MTSQVRSKIKCFAGHGSTRESAITSSKTHFIENQRGASVAQYICCYQRSLIIPGQVTGQVTKGQPQHMNPISLGLCDACFMDNFFISNSMVLVIRTSGTVKVTSWWRSGQCQVKKGKISKLKFLHQMGIESMQLTASLMVAFVLRYVVQNC